MRLITCLLFAAAAHAAVYYVDSRTGDDAGPGSRGRPWRSLEKVNVTRFSPGDHVLLASGSVWQGQQLAPTASGAVNSPIIIEQYGRGGTPRIEAGGKFEDAILLKNVQWIEVRNLEATNQGAAPAPRRGVHIVLDNFGTAKHIVVAGLFIHDVNGTNERKDNGGIIFRTIGNTAPSRFDELRIERNIVWKVDRSAIAAQSYHYPRTRWFPSLNVVIRDNFVDDIGGDGIVPWATDGALIEHNIARNCNRRANTYNAGIWPWSTDNSVFRLNEAYLTRTTMDGQGFDSDYNSRNSVFEYNYSHDNEGGFMLICTPGQRNQAENLGNTGTVVRRNVSRNDLARIFHLSAAEQTTVEDNAIYVGPGIDIQMLIVTNWSGWADGAVFRRNTMYVDGTARYGYEIRREKDGTYAMAPGWGPAKNIVFEGNRYYGNHLDRPPDAEAVTGAATPPAVDWKAPEFDPSRPVDFHKFLRDHRIWMIKLMEAHFGPVNLAE